jgi:hypothetical protein
MPNKTTSPLTPNDRSFGPTPAADVFAGLWRTLSDLLGTTTTATLLRCSLNAVARRSAALADLHIDLAGFEYHYTLPGSWLSSDGGGLAAMRELIAELRPRLMELTGSVILKHLEANPAIAQSGVLSLQ